MSTYGVPYSTQFDVAGLGDLQQRIELAIKSRAQTGDTVFTVRAGGARGGAKNAMIAAVHAARGRKGIYVNPKAKQNIRDAAAGLFSAVAGVRRAAEDVIKNLLLVSIGENVQAQRNPDGAPFRKLTANYAAFKQRKYGFSIPILRATGDLLGGLKVFVERIGRGN